MHMNIYVLINDHTCTHKHEWVLEYTYVSFLSEKMFIYMYRYIEVSCAKFEIISLSSVKYL